MRERQSERIQVRVRSTAHNRPAVGCLPLAELVDGLRQKNLFFTSFSEQNNLSSHGCNRKSALVPCQVLFCVFLCALCATSVFSVVKVYHGEHKELTEDTKGHPQF